MSKHLRFSVLVGNIGMVRDGVSRAEALAVYGTYVEQSKSGVGRAGGESVTLFEREEPIREYFGSNDVNAGIGTAGERIWE